MELTTGSNKKLSEKDICRMINFLIVMFGGRVFQQTVGIPIGNKLGTTSRRFFPFFRMKLTSFRAFCKEKGKGWLNRVIFTFRYIGAVLSLNSSEFGDYVNRIFTNELKIKDTTE